MAKQVIKNYTFDAVNKTVTLTDFSVGQPVLLERLALITDTTTNQILYNFADSSIATAAVSSNNVVTLSALPGGVASSDKLRIDYETSSGDPTYDGSSTTVTANIGTTGGLALDATLTGGTQQTKSTDGTTVASNLAGDAGQNARLVAGSRKEVSFTTTTAQAVGATDASNYVWVSVQIQSQGTSSTVTFQASNDNTNWYSMALSQTSATLSAGLTNTTGTGVFHGALPSRYFRLNVTGISAGTTSGTIEFFSQAHGLHSLGVSASQNGTWTIGSNSATGAAAPANAFYVGMVNNSANLTGLKSGTVVGDAGNADAVLATQGFVYNGATVDRLRSATSAAGTTGTGVPAAGAMGFDGTNYQRLSTNTSGVQNINLSPSSTGGWTPFFVNTVTSTVTVSSAAGKFGGYMLINLNSAPAYLQVFDTTGAVTLGTTTPTFVLAIPANATPANGLAANLELTVGVSIANGIKIAATTTPNGSTTVTTGLTGSIWYK